MEQKIDKMFFIFQIVAFELRVVNFHNLEQNTCHQQSMCEHLPLIFHLKLGETFSKSTSMRMMEKHDISWIFRKYLGCFQMLTVKACPEMVLFRECSNEAFHIL